MSWEEVGTNYYELKTLDGGLNANDEDVQDNQSMECANVYHKHKALRNMYGGTLFVDDPVVEGSPVTGIYQFRTDAGGNYIIATCSNKIKKLSGDSWVDITGTATVTAGVKVQFATIGNRLIGTDGTNNPWTTTDAASCADLAGSPPKGKYIAAYRGFAVLGNCTVGATAYPQRAYRSGLWAPTSWNTTDDYWAFETATATPITGLLAQNSRFVALKEDCIGYVLGASAATFSSFPQAFPNIGCLSGYAIGSGTFYLKGQKIVGAIFPGSDGLYLLPDGGAPFPVTPNIAPHYRKLDMTYMSGAVGGYFSDMKQHLTFAPSGLGTSGVNDAGYLFDAENAGAWPLSGIKATCTAVIKDPTTKKEKFLIGLSNGRIVAMDPPIPGVSYGSYEIDGDSLASKWVSNWFDLNDSTMLKLLRELLFYIYAVGNNSLTVRIELRGAQRTRVYESTITPGDATGEYDFVYGLPYARAGLQMSVPDSGTSPGMKARGFRWGRITVEQTGAWGWAMQKIGLRIFKLGQRRVA